MHSRTLVTVASLLAGCFQPADTRVPIRCDADNPCPAQQVCQAGLCGFGPQPDLSVSSDMDGPDMTISSVGCASSGTKIGDRMWGCPGPFAIGQARSLCAGGWTVCKSVADVDLPACHSQSTVFIADVPAYQPSAGVLMCATTTAFQRLFAACGTTGTVLLTSSCSGFDRFAIDKQYGFDFANGHTIDKAIGTTSNNGVLCCR